ncbi:hypothetical protein D3C81_821610 [compost metagenome]
MEPVAHAGHGGTHGFIPGEVARLHGEVAGIVADGHVVAQEVMVALACTDRAIGQQRLADIVLGMQRTEGVVGARLAPGLGVIVAYVVGIRHLGVGTDQHPLLRCIGVALGMAEVCRKPQALATKVQAQHRHFALDTLVVPFSVARLFHAIETHAELLAFAKAPANVHRTACLARRGIAAGKLGERLVTGPLGLHIDATADTASR